MANHYHNLNPEKALLWRIVHRDNLSWILSNGLHCKSSSTQDPNYIAIGNTELIDRRSHRAVPVAPGGFLSDYVPFYFTPFSPMLYNIYTGRGGVRQRANEEICILISSFHKLRDLDLQIVFTDRHAYPKLARYFDDGAPPTSAKLTGRSFRREISKEILTTPSKSNATRPKPWRTATCQYPV